MSQLRQVLADDMPRPRRPQPGSLAPPLTCLVSDVLLPSLSIPVYRRGLRRTWGGGMAQVAVSTRRWTVLLAIGVVAGFVVGRFLGRRKS